MPKKEIDLEYKIEHLSVLNEDGELDADLEPDISDDLLVKMHRTMLLTRRFDERMLKLQRQGKMGTFGPIKGQEAAQIGAAAVLKEKDWLAPSFREMAAEVWRGKSMEDILLVYAGFNEGGLIPEESHTLPVCIPVATQIPHAAGLAYAVKFKKEENVVMVFHGDGATSEGDFHEGLNFAAVFQTPTVFVCQNNQWAISIPRSKQTYSKTLAQKALAYGMPGIQVDGNDVLAVYSAAKDAVERARSGDGPTLIECATYRMSVHTTADDPSKYRDEEEVKEWEKRDPITRFQKYLKEKDLLSDEDIDNLEAEIKSDIKEVVQSWEEKMEDLGDPTDMFTYQYAELPPHLVAQKEEFEAMLSEKE
ncbi:MAG: pyruvate dehydrogenase (acetyl-transferring) E1 component subunit alpha [Desulfococcaceae bacterium]